MNIELTEIPLAAFWHKVTIEDIKKAMESKDPLDEFKLREIIHHLIHEVESQRELTAFWRKDAEMSAAHLKAMEKYIEGLKGEGNGPTGKDRTGEGEKEGSKGNSEAAC